MFTLYSNCQCEVTHKSLSQSICFSVVWTSVGADDELHDWKIFNKSESDLFKNMSLKILVLEITNYTVCHNVVSTFDWATTRNPLEPTSVTLYLYETQYPFVRHSIKCR